MNYHFSIYRKTLVVRVFFDAQNLRDEEVGLYLKQN